jgi:hypothetical protein
MSTTTNSVVQKLTAVFGTGAVLTAIYKGGKVTYSDGATRLGLDVPEADKKADGTYTATLVSETELVEKFVEPVEEPKANVKAEPSTRQSPMGGAETRQSR